MEVQAPEISEDEAALYDRQIRLWGLDAQRRLRAANVLLAGLKGLGCEVAKNVILSGVDRITLMDDEEVKKTDLESAFFLPRDSVGKNRAASAVVRAQKLNPMVKITVDTQALSSKEEQFFKAFDVVVVTDATEEEMIRVSDICHALGKQFFAGDVYGIYGFCFTDLGEHDYAEEMQKPKAKLEDDGDDGDGPPEKRQKTGETENGDGAKKKPEMETVVVKKHASFVSLRHALTKFDWKAKENERQLKRVCETYPITRVLLQYRSSHCGSLPDPQHRSDEVTALEEIAASHLKDIGIPPEKLSKSWATFAFSELSPVCAIVGGVLGGEVIKAVSLRDPPHNNFFFYNGFQGDGFVERIG